MSETKALNGLKQFIQDYYQTKEVPLHTPIFQGNERKYVLETIDSTFVSSIGSYVSQFESVLATYTKSPAAVAIVNGTAALHIALILAGVQPGDLVITQPLTFVATCNAISYCGAKPVFIDVDLETLGLSPGHLSQWLEEHAFIDDSGNCMIRDSGQQIKVCLPMHTFGHPADLDPISKICQAWNLILIEDAAESLGSLYKGKHTGTIGDIGCISFNGNKIVTTGGGGMILTSKEYALQAKHLTTTAKVPHPYNFIHDEIGYNYRLPNINAALGVAQMEMLDRFIFHKRNLANLYSKLCDSLSVHFVTEPADCKSNYWLNAIICEDLLQRDYYLNFLNKEGVMCRPAWQLMSELKIHADHFKGPLSTSKWLVERIINLPSSVRTRDLNILKLEEKNIYLET